MSSAKNLRDERGDREKKTVALSSVLAAVFLAVMKLVMGLLTGSLGILAEAAHSGLDLIAAGVTYFAVRVSGRPPDSEHHYGHGKIENLSALVETLLLLAVCAWIVYEATSRLFFKTAHVEVSFWCFLVMGISIIVDISRSRALMRAAKRYNSQALEADALHFSTDVWSSCVVIVGLIGVVVANYLEASAPAVAQWFRHADSIAALGVSAIVVYVSVRLGRRTIAVLLDKAPEGIRTSIQREMTKLPGVLGVKQIRVRQSGPVTFVDLVLLVKAEIDVERAHCIAVEAENLVRQSIRNADVMVHLEPCTVGESDPLKIVRGIAAAHGVEVHDLTLRNIDGHQTLEMHAEVPEDLNVDRAHERISAMEESLIRGIPQVQDVVVHIEPTSSNRGIYATESLVPTIQETIDLLRMEYPSVHDCHSISITSDSKSQLSLSFHCSVSPQLTIGEAHHLTTRIEAFLRHRFPNLVQIIIHVEPHKKESKE